MNVNKAIIIGRLTRDPELRTTPSGQQVASLGIATSFKYKDKSGQQQEKTEFHNVVAWGRQAEIIGQYFTKGQEIYVEGRLETSTWDDKETGKKMYKTEIVLEKFEFGAKPQGSAGSNYAQNSQQQQSQSASAPNQSGQSSTPSQPNSPEKVKQVEEDIPTINLEDEDKEVKVEDVPF